MSLALPTNRHERRVAAAGRVNCDATRGAFWTPAQLAASLGLTERTLYEKRRNGTGPRFIRLTGNRVLYRIEDVDAWLNGRTYQHIAGEAVGLTAA